MTQAQKATITALIAEIIASKDVDALRFAYTFMAMYPMQYASADDAIEWSAIQLPLAKELIRLGGGPYIHRISVNMVTNESQEPWAAVREFVTTLA